MLWGGEHDRRDSQRDAGAATQERTVI